MGGVPQLVQEEDFALVTQEVRERMGTVVTLNVSPGEAFSTRVNK